MRHILATFTLAMCWGQSAWGAPPTSEKLNIMVIMSDDMHRNSLGCYGSQVEDITPNIDAFAAGGMKFTQAHINNPICGPSRKVLATGLYGHNSGAMGFMKVKDSTVSILDRLRPEGYLLGILGKVEHSTPKGSDRWDFSYEQSDLGGGRSPKLYYDRCVDFFKQCKAEKKPFYFMVNSHDPHLPWYNPSKGATFEGEEAPSRLYQPDEFPVPEHLPDIPGVRKQLAYFYNSTKRFDDTFGKVIQALEESGLRDNTLVLFIQDNGIPTPFAKANTYLASSRTPFIVQLPGTVPPSSVNDSLVEEVDFVPTILDILGLPPMGRRDGQSIRPVLEDPAQDTGRKYVFTQIDAKISGPAVPMRAIQDGKFCYIYNMWSKDGFRYSNANEKQVMAAMEGAAKTDPDLKKRIELYRYRVPEELYDLENDPGNLNNLIDSPSHKDKLEELRVALGTRMAESHDPTRRAFENRYDLEIVREEFGKIFPSKGKAKKRNKGS